MIDLLTKASGDATFRKSFFNSQLTKFNSPDPDPDPPADDDGSNNGGNPTGPGSGGGPGKAYEF